jgi:hypothetical protein
MKPLFTRTRYTRGNGFLLALGFLLCVLIFLMFMMGWGPPVTDFRSLCEQRFADGAIFAIPAFLLAFILAGLSCAALWSICAWCITFAILARSYSDATPCVFLALLSLVVTVIHFSSLDAADGQRVGAAGG